MIKQAADFISCHECIFAGHTWAKRSRFEENNSAVLPQCIHQADELPSDSYQRETAFAGCAAIDECDGTGRVLNVAPSDLMPPVMTGNTNDAD